MIVIERKVINYIKQNKAVFFCLTVSFLALVIRLFGRHFVSLDMSGYLLPWYEEAILNGGVHSIANPIGDYNIPYQFFVGLITHLPINPVTAYKLLSIVFDYILAFSTSLLICELLQFTKHKNNKESIFCLSYASILMLPSVWMNSGFWGQADSIYTSFIVLSLLFLVRTQYNFSFIFLGLAFAFKFQTIFIVPVYFFYYVIHTKYSVFRLVGITLASFYALCIPGFLFGRGLLEPLSIYASQAGYEYIYANYPSFWALFLPYAHEIFYGYINKLSVLLSFVILLCGLMYLLYKRISLIRNVNIVYVSIFVIYTLVLFLVNMHDRYAYLLDIMLIVLFFLDRKSIFYFILPFIITHVMYGNFLFRQMSFSYDTLAALNIMNYILLCLYISKKIEK